MKVIWSFGVTVISCACAMNKGITSMIIKDGRNTWGRIAILKFNM
jgi:hypothetical protein